MNEKRFSLDEIRQVTGGELSSASSIKISGVASLKDAGAEEITFLTSARHLEDFQKTKAAAVIISPEILQNHDTKKSVPLLIVEDPYLAFSKVMNLFYARVEKRAGIMENVITGKNFQAGSDITIYPFVFLGDDTVVGDGTEIHPHVFIGNGTKIGSRCLIYPNVTIGEGVAIGDNVIMHSGTVIGSDGFGFATAKGKHHKIAHVGGVIIEDDVEIGANCTIDRAVFGNTIIESGTKIDNLVHIGHNCVIGSCSLLAGQVGIAGSTTTGDHVIMAGKSGVVGHVKIARMTTVAAKAGITKDTEEGQVVSGFPAMAHKDWLKRNVTISQIPQVKKDIKNLKKQIQLLQNRLSKKA